MTTTSRVLALLERLQGGGTHRVAELADHFGVDERTVRRDVARLVELDVPVRTVRGRYGGYRIEPGFRIPPLMFSDDEAVAVLVGLELGDRVADDATTRATAKLRRVLPQALNQRLDAVRSTVDVVAGQGPGHVVADHARNLLVLAEAARDRRPVVLDYTDRRGRRRERTVHPYGVVALSGRLYLSAYDVDRADVRTFRLDRIGWPSPRPGTFSVPEGLDPAAEVLAGLARTPWRHEVVLRLRAGASDAAAAFPAGLAVVDDEPPEPGWVRVRLRAERLDWVPGLLAALPHDVAVEAPDELRALVLDLGRRLVNASGGLTPSA